MDKKQRKELEQQLGISIAYLLKKQDEVVAAEMTKAIRSASKDLAKKFLKVKSAQAEKAEKRMAKEAKQKLKEPKAAKKVAKKAVKKAVKKTVKRQSASKKSSRMS